MTMTTTKSETPLPTAETGHDPVPHDTPMSSGSVAAMGGGSLERILARITDAKTKKYVASADNIYGIWTRAVCEELDAIRALASIRPSGRGRPRLGEQAGESATEGHVVSESSVPARRESPPEMTDEEARAVRKLMSETMAFAGQGTRRLSADVMIAIQEMSAQVIRCEKFVASAMARLDAAFAGDEAHAYELDEANAVASLVNFVQTRTQIKQAYSSIPKSSRDKS